MRNPHRLAAPFAIDPLYSSTRRTPDGRGLSLFGGGGAGNPWLYAAGDLAAHLMAEQRRSVFLNVRNVGHPGIFPPPRACVYFSGEVSVARRRVFRFLHSGDLSLSVNGVRVFRAEAPALPVICEVDLTPWLTGGKNGWLMVLCASGGPCCLRLESGSSKNVRCSADGQKWEAPEEFPFAGLRQFPHQEKAPFALVPAKERSGKLYDFGVEVVGRLRVKGGGRFVPGESAEEAGYEGLAEQEPVEVASGEGTSHAESAFRYVRQEGRAAAGSVQCEFTAHPVAYKGAFASSDPELTRIWQHAAYTLRLCLREITVDGVKRDRLPWVGDLYLSQVCNAYTFGEHALFLRTLLSLHHGQTDRVDLSGIFDYTLLWVVAAGDYLRYSGDHKGAAMLLPRVEGILEHLERRLTPEGFLASDKVSWIFIDWAEIPRSGVLLTIQSLYLQALESAAFLATGLGEARKAALWKRQIARLRAAVGRGFWRERSGRFGDSLDSRSPGGRHANAFAVLSGTGGKRAGAGLLSAIADAATPAIKTPYMRYFEEAAMCRIGRPRAMIDRVKEYWGGMLRAGATTFWEAYDPSLSGAEHLAFYGRPFGKSLCHAWAAGPLALFSSELFGLRPVAPGWSSFTFSPPPAGLEWAAVTVPTPKGPIHAEVEGNNAILEMPAGCGCVEAPLGSSTSSRIGFRRERGKWRSVSA